MSKFSFKEILQNSGPGWLQGALSIGGGTLASSMFLGVLGGYSMLWVQPVAMAMGIIMLSTIAYVTLTLEKSPFQVIRHQISPFLAWSWLIAALIANIVWALPQFALAYGALTENLFSDFFSQTTVDGTPIRYDMGYRIGISVLLFGLVAAVSLTYGQKTLTARLYESIMKTVVAGIMLAFFGVVVYLTLNNRVDWGGMFAGFIPQPQHFFVANDTFKGLLDAIPAEEARAFWNDLVVTRQREVLLGAAAAAVGINMTFLMAFSLLAKGWGKSKREYAIIDLAGGLFIPFVFASSCIIIASAAQFHGKTLDGISIDPQGQIQVDNPLVAKRVAEIDGFLDRRTAAVGELPLDRSESVLAATLVNRDNFDLANSLEQLFQNEFLSQKVFGLGVMAVALSSASLMMVISGFCIMEAFGVKYASKWHRLGMMVPILGIFWPIVWAGGSKAYLAVIASTVGYTMIPIAFLAFYLMFNSKKILGADIVSTKLRSVWNVLILFSLTVTTAASITIAWNKYILGFPIGKVIFSLFVIFLIVSFARGSFKKKTSE